MPPALIPRRNFVSNIELFTAEKTSLGSASHHASPYLSHLRPRLLSRQQNTSSPKPFPRVAISQDTRATMTVERDPNPPPSHTPTVNLHASIVTTTIPSPDSHALPGSSGQHGLTRMDIVMVAAIVVLSTIFVVVVVMIYRLLRNSQASGCAPQATKKKGTPNSHQNRTKHSDLKARGTVTGVRLQVALDRENVDRCITTWGKEQHLSFDNLNGNEKPEKFKIVGTPSYTVPRIPAESKARTRQPLQTLHHNSVVERRGSTGVFGPSVPACQDESSISQNRIRSEEKDIASTPGDYVVRTSQKCTLDHGTPTLSSSHPPCAFSCRENSEGCDVANEIPRSDSTDHHNNDGTAGPVLSIEHRQDSRPDLSFTDSNLGSEVSLTDVESLAREEVIELVELKRNRIHETEIVDSESHAGIAASSEENSNSEAVGVIDTCAPPCATEPADLVSVGQQPNASTTRLEQVPSLVVTHPSSGSISAIGMSLSTVSVDLVEFPVPPSKVPLPRVEVTVPAANIDFPVYLWDEDVGRLMVKGQVDQVDQLISMYD